MRTTITRGAAAIRRRLALAGTRARRLARPLLRRQFHRGYCPICARPTLFVQTGAWLRDDYLCPICWSIPRQRALICVLERLFPGWRGLRIHESSPGGASSRKLQRECRGYTPTHYYPDTAPGAFRQGVRCENLERMTFGDAAFDLTITQDVFEHVLGPGPAFAEIARTLRPGGAHVFTVPYYGWKPTLVRAVRTPEGLRHLAPPEYHGNPIDPNGSLVVTEWGPELIETIARHSGMATAALTLRDRRMGLEAEFLEVFVSVKPGQG